MNTYKTFSDISTKQNETQKINTTLNSTYKKNKNYYDYENNFLIIEETFNTYRESHNNSNSKNSKYSKGSKGSKNKEHELRTEEGLFNGNVLYFDEYGLKYGLRGKKDGYGFFGTSTHYHGKIINDYVLNISNFTKANSNGLRKNSNLSTKTYSLTNDENNNMPIVYFVIYYEKETKKFFLKNVRRINYDNLESFIFSFGIYKRYINNNIKIKENIIICFNENQNYVLAMQPMNNFILRTYLIKIDSIYNGNNNYNKSIILYKSNIENNGVSITIGNKGNIKIDLQGKNYFLIFNKIEKCWEIKSNNKNNEIFWIIIDKKTELIKENIFKINTQFYKIIYNQ